MTRDVWALVPFKGLKGAKRRLKPHLTEAEREGLVEAMLSDVLSTLAAHEALDHVVLISRAPEAKTFADRFGVDVYPDQATDLIGAVTEASDFVRSRSPEATTFFVPGDVPLITATDIDDILAGHVDITIIPDGSDIGTNGSLSTPPNLHRYLFDGKSFLPHVAAAREVGIEPRIVRAPSFAIDVDTVSELATLARGSAENHTARFLKTSGVASRLPRLHNPSPP